MLPATFGVLLFGVAFFASLPAAASGFALGPIGKALEQQGDTCPAMTKGGVGWDKPLVFTPAQAADKTVLMISGTFTAGDAARLESYLRTAPAINEIWFDSGGGNAAEGPKVGRVIRAARLGTRVASGYMCASSCTLAFLGGIVRRVEPGASYAVHTFFAAKSPDSYRQLLDNKQKSADQKDREFREGIHQQEQRNALLAAEWQVYVQQMGVSRALLTNLVLQQRSLVFMTDAEIIQLRQSGMPDSEIAQMLQTIRCPSGSDLRRYNVVNVSD